MFNLLMEVTLQEMTNNYANFVTLGGYDLLGFILMLIFFGFLLWKFRINLTAGTMIVMTLISGMDTFYGGFWRVIDLGIFSFFLIAFGLLLVKYFNR